MGRKLAASDKKKKDAEEKYSFLRFCREELTEVYLVLMLAIYPLFMGKGYEDLVFAKWKLLKYGSAVFITGSLLVGGPELFAFIKSGFCKKEETFSATRKRSFGGWLSALSVTDRAVLLYLVCVLISYGWAADRQASLYGVDTWYMGLIAQLIFVGIYLAISRGYAELRYLKLLAEAVFTVVCGILLLQRFGVDVLSFYKNLPESVKLNFVTTMGQVTWTSSYISILLIVGIGCFFTEKRGFSRILTGACVAVGFAAEAVLNCDSGILAVLSCLLVLFWFAMANKERMLAFLEILLLALASFGAVGVLERIFAERMIPIDAVYLRLSQSPALLVLLAVSGIAYALLRKNIRGSGRIKGGGGIRGSGRIKGGEYIRDSKRIRDDGDKRHGKTVINGKTAKSDMNGNGGKMEKKRERITSLRIARSIYAGLLALAALTVVLLFILHGKGYFAGSPTENYFRFTVWWGNSRGFIWRTGAAVFADFNIGRKLFGCGPDGFTPYAYGLMGDAINEFWSNQIVPNVHNEWFNAIINYGLVGGLAYLSIFVTAAARYIRAGLKAASESPALLGVGLAAVGYFVHNFLCYQQMIGTPLIFLLLGLGEALHRELRERT